MKLSIINRRKRSSRKKEKQHSHEYPPNKATTFGCIWSPKDADSASSRNRLAPDNRAPRLSHEKRFAIHAPHTNFNPAIITLPNPAVQVLIGNSALPTTHTQDVFPEAREGFRRGPCTCKPTPTVTAQITSPQWRGTSLSLSQKIFNGLNASQSAPDSTNALCRRSTRSVSP
jgi:hypothetical protein